MKVVVTCGIILFNPDNKILIGHPTNQPQNTWSIPKGLPDGNEPNLNAALREFKEETGINLLEILPWEGPIEIIGKFIYPNKKKILMAYKLKIMNDIDINEFHCDSMVPAHVYGKEVPEIDEFRWVTISEAMELIHPSQKEALLSINT